MVASGAYRVAEVVFLTVDDDQTADQLDAENRAPIRSSREDETTLRDRIATDGSLVRRVARESARRNGRIPVVERRKPGRSSKGPREEVRARVPVELRRALQDEATRRGMTFNDFIGEALSELVSVPYTPQRSMPLTRAS